MNYNKLIFEIKSQQIPLSHLHTVNYNKLIFEIKSQLLEEADMTANTVIKDNERTICKQITTINFKFSLQIVVILTIFTNKYLN